MSLEFLASAEVYLGLFRSAERNSSESVRLFRSRSAASPGVARYKSWSFQGLTRQAQARVNLGHHARASASIREARELLDHMGPETSLDRFERQMIAELELARGTILAEQGRECRLRQCGETLRGPAPEAAPGTAEPRIRAASRQRLGG
jgi:hypothetical protein